MRSLQALLALAVLLSLAGALAPMREGIRRAVLSAFSVIFLLALIPSDLSFSIEDLISIPARGDFETGALYDQTLEEGVEKGLRQDLCSRFSLEEEALILDCVLEKTENTLAVSYLTITLTGKNALADATGMVAYIEKAYGAYCELHLRYR